MPSQLFDRALFDALSAGACAHPRLRLNHNLHSSPLDPVQRFFNAIEPGSYVMPHRHLAADKAETLLMLRGQIGLILFDDAGQITHTQLLALASDCPGFHLAAGSWHSIVALEPGSIFFETKAGPYVPISAAERAPWAPAEGTPEAAAFERGLRQLFA